ncbi:MAG: VCBS repeat-containing protein [Anaeromyxobacter sp.]|nr:VCBS repeat-containing protein [Anaeromyxobacter sp.]MBL0276288.1 VCBS repeat-containing protein [Anaeromyxobacter sp.]
MAWLALLLALAPAALPGAPGGEAGALSALAAEVADQVGAPEAGRRGLALSLQAQGALGPPLAAALTAALGRAGWAVSPGGAASAGAAPDGREGTVDGPSAGAVAAPEADWRLTLTAGGGEDGQALVAVGQAVARWPSFFLQARPGVPAAPPRPVSARVLADDATRLLLGPPRRPELGRATLRRLARLPYPVLALAAGEAGEAGLSLLVVSPGAVHLLDAAGAELASRPLDPASRRPVRLAAATAVVGPLGGGRLGLGLAGAPGGEVLVRRGGRLDVAASLPLAPLAAGQAGLLFGAFAPGKGALSDLLATWADPAALPRTPRDLVAVAAAPGPSPVAFAALGPDAQLQLLDADLAALGAVPGVGAGFALADLDGDGAAELVASRATAGPGDALRVLRLEAHPPAGLPAPAFESAEVEGAFTAGTAADLTGDGLDDALLAAEVRGPDGAPATDLWLLSLDARESP